MKNCILAFLALFLLTLSGCAVSEQSQKNGAPEVNWVEKAKTDVKNDLAGMVEEKFKSRDDKTKNVSDKVDSQNAIQANVNALLGASIGKLGEDVTGVKVGQADLVRIQTDLKNDFSNQMRDVNTQLTNQIKLTAEMKVALDTNIKISNDMRVELNNQIKVNADLEAKLKVSVDSQVQAQVGFNDKINTVKTDLTNDLKAGHDVIQNQLDANALKAVQSGNLVAIIIIGAFALVAMALGVCYVIVRLHSKAREESESHNREMFKVMARCIPDKKDA
jgi:hypothetical protein